MNTMDEKILVFIKPRNLGQRYLNKYILQFSVHFIIVV